MSNPITESKIELVTEAIETLVLATVVAQGSGDRAAHYQNVVDARETVKDCLREFLAPTLRVVETKRHSRAGELETTLTRTVIEGAREIEQNLA